jgi:hypothetical protein
MTEAFYCFIKDDYDIGNSNNHNVSIELLTATHIGRTFKTHSGPNAQQAM